MLFLLAPLLALPAIIIGVIILITILIIVGLVLLIKKLTKDSFREHCTVCGGGDPQNVETLVSAPDCAEVEPIYSVTEPDHLNFE